MKRICSTTIKITGVAVMVSISVLTIATWQYLQPLPASLTQLQGEIKKPQLLSRNNRPITITYANEYNLHDVIELSKVPELIQTAFIYAEDKRFYQHQGIDWMARMHATWQNIKQGSIVRGASTISEQVVRLLHPRKRKAWSRWMESIEVKQLEARFSKTEILEFYLNQVPYAGNRRGIVQAARYYFDRSLDTLNTKEMLALAVMVRSPSRMDLHKDHDKTERAIERLAYRLYQQGIISGTRFQEIQFGRFEIAEAVLDNKANHFAEYIYNNLDDETPATIRTTLDLGLQQKVHGILQQRLIGLRHLQVNNGAVMVVDNENNEVLAWVVASNKTDSNAGSKINAVLTPRQPGSTLKPFLYANALSKGWTAASLINDEPLSEMVGAGIHSYQNYSRIYYGRLPLRKALGNSLNIPAVKAMQFVGADQFLDKLYQLGIRQLQQHPDVYGDGIALGNGELSLYELLQAYTVLARHGQFKKLCVRYDDPACYEKYRIYTPEVSSLIANILSDPEARALEFGRSSVLNLPVQTAVKTGTSNDYRDAWTVGFNSRYTVGVWMGNLDRSRMQRVTGASGPALVLRGIFAELNRLVETKPLYLSPALIQKEICTDTSITNDPACPKYTEWFVPGTGPGQRSETRTEISKPKIDTLRIRQPSNGLQMAMDPRIPDAMEMFRFELSDNKDIKKVKWYVDGKLVSVTDEANYLWALQAGEHQLTAGVLTEGEQDYSILNTVSFTVR